MARKAKRPVPPSGVVIYEGPSLIDGSPIVCIATLHSSNGKTGDMIQTWIMRADIDPLAASRSGADRAICGDCGSRGTATNKKRGVARNRKCYVLLQNAPVGIWKCYRRGGYPVAAGHASIAAVARGRKVRVGAYGDGAAMPSYIVESLLSECAGHTAYSHQSGNAASSFDRAIYMVSADTRAEAEAAWQAGRRTFRVVRDLSEMVVGKEAPCPSLVGRHCIDCLLCGGTSGTHAGAKSIVIPAHGAGAKYFEGETA